MINNVFKVCGGLRNRMIYSMLFKKSLMLNLANWGQEIGGGFYPLTQGVRH